MDEETKKRFWEKVSKGDGCWTWQGAPRGKSGYGAFKVNGKVMDAHKVSFIISKGRQPNGWVLHSCDNRMCVKPAHLREGSALENAREMFARGRGHNKKKMAKYAKYDKSK